LYFLQFILDLICHLITLKLNRDDAKFSAIVARVPGYPHVG